MKVVLLFSATESDPWVSEILSTVAGQLGFEAFSKPSASGHLDVFGPYDCKFGEREGTLTVAMSGLSSVSDLTGQQVLGQEVLDWLAAQQPTLVWLDGDPAQFQVGHLLDDATPIVFTGVVLTRDLYYDPQRAVTGVYRRHSVSRVLNMVWATAPDARKFALLSDDSPVSMSRVQDMLALEQALPKGDSWVLTKPVHDWDELRARLAEVKDTADAAIVCGMGEWSCSAALLEQPCPADMLSGFVKPVVVLGPSRMDSSGAISLRIKPPVHARLALAMVAKVLGGADPCTLAVSTPDDMATFRAEPETEAAKAKAAEEAEKNKEQPAGS